MFQTILTAIDRSDNAERAFDVALALAKPFEGTLLLVHVIPLPPLYGYDPKVLDDEEAVHVHDEYLSLYLNAARGEGKTLLGRYAARAEAAGVKVATQLCEGHVVAQLLRIARERAVDLIVLGAKGTSRVPRLFMGSVSEKVTRVAPCPVLVVK